MSPKHPIVTCQKCGTKVEIIAVRGGKDVKCTKCDFVLLRLTSTTRKVLPVGDRP